MKNYYIVRSIVELSKWFPKNIDGVVFGKHIAGTRWNNKVYLYISTGCIILEINTSNLYYGPILYYKKSQAKGIYKAIYHLIKDYNCHLFNNEKEYIYKSNTSKMKYVAERLNINTKDLENIWNV